MKVTRTQCVSSRTGGSERGPSWLPCTSEVTSPSLRRAGCGRQSPAQAPHASRTPTLHGHLLQQSLQVLLLRSRRLMEPRQHVAHVSDGKLSVSRVPSRERPVPGAGPRRTSAGRASASRWAWARPCRRGRRA